MKQFATILIHINSLLPVLFHIIYDILFISDLFKQMRINFHTKMGVRTSKKILIPIHFSYYRQLAAATIIS